MSSSWKEGKATTGDMSVIKTFTEVMGPEYNAVGLRAMYGYMADLFWTEPRWYRAQCSTRKTPTSTPTS